MKFGICIPIRRNVKPHVNIEIAKKAEELGFDSIWASDHVVVPDKYIGRFSEVFYDPFVILASIAAQTSKIKIGTSVIILPYRNPVVVAKMVATLDVLSEGRFIFGVASGWMREEYDVLSIPYHERGKRTDEYIRIMKELWGKGNPKFEGEFFRFSNIKFYPRPLQQPHPPIWIGGNSERALRRAVELGDGWQPTGVSPDDIEIGVRYIKRFARDRGRELENFVLSARNRLRIFDKSKEPSHATQAKRSLFSLCGKKEEIISYMQRFKEGGVSHMVVDPTAKDGEEMFETMERFSEVMSMFRD
ncbi:MAG TPA: LLM class F420-dependent oxidoreductase [Thermodesulfobacteriota bacterium]|nr:LLM class F420-dependent oxidoreductase [Thermodesulfobacteriota bacterium]